MSIIDDALQQLLGNGGGSLYMPTATGTTPITQTPSPSTQAPIPPAPAPQAPAPNPFQYYIPQQQPQMQPPQGMQSQGSPNLSQSMLKNFMNPQAAPNPYQNQMSPISQAQLGQMAQAGGLGPAQLDNPGISPNMQLYLQNLSRPSVYNQGLPAIQAPAPAPEFDFTSSYDDLLRKYGATESDRPAGMTDVPMLIQQNDNDQKRSWLEAWMAMNQKDSWVDYRRNQYNLLNSGLADIDKKAAQFKKDNKVPVAYPSYTTSLW